MINRMDLINVTSLNPWFLTGFIDGEGCFRISLTKIKGGLGWRVQLFFQINLHVKDKVLLENIRDFLGVGKIHDPPIFDGGMVKILFNIEFRPLMN